MKVGPFTKRDVNDASWKESTYYKTVRDTPRVPLPYDSFSAVKTAGDSSLKVSDLSVFYWTNNWGPEDRLWEEVDRLCWSRLKGELGPTVQMAMNALEARQTGQMLLKAAKALHHPLRTVGELMRNAARKSNRMTAGNLLLGEVNDAYLAFQYGVKPIMQDIYALVEQQKLKDPVGIRIHGSAKRPLHRFQPNDAYHFWGFDEHYKYSMKRSVVVSVENPNLFAAGQLGLVNPAVVLFDRYPLSFVLNWFWPIQQWMASWTDFVGLRLEAPYTTKFISGVGTSFYRDGEAIRLWGVDACKWHRSDSLLGPAFPTHLKCDLSASQVVAMGSLLFQRLNREATLNLATLGKRQTGTFDTQFG